jgi:hypothetical protein
MLSLNTLGADLDWFGLGPLPILFAVEPMRWFKVSLLQLGDGQY